MAGRAEEYRSEMKDISLTDEERGRMAARLAGAVTGGGAIQLGPRARTRRTRRLAVAAAAAGLTLAVGLGGYAFATGQLVSVADLVQGVFGAAPAKTEVVGKVGRPVNASVTHDGVTVSADAIMGDDHSYVVVYSISRTDGQPLANLADGAGTTPGDYVMTLADGRWLVPEAMQRVSGSTAEGGAQWLYDADPTDNAIQLVIAYGTNTDVVGQTVHMTFRGLQAWSGSDDSQEDLLSGQWDLAFKLDYESDDVTLGGGQHITLPETGTGATIREVSVSSVGVTVDYTADATEVDDIPEDQPDGYWGGPTVIGLGDMTVTLRDGSQIVVDGSGGTADEGDQDTTNCRVTGFLDRVIDPADVASVTICGVTVGVA